MNIISTGGVMKEGYLAFLGSRTEEAIRSYFVDKVIISCKALDAYNAKTGYDIPIHVDAATGGFILPFLSPETKWKGVITIPVMQSN